MFCGFGGWKSFYFRFHWELGNFCIFGKGGGGNFCLFCLFIYFCFVLFVVFGLGFLFLDAFNKIHFTLQLGGTYI